MAVNYEIPRWIAPAQPAEFYLRGAQIGLSAAQGQQEMAMRAGMQQQETAARMAMQQQQLAAAAQQARAELENRRFIAKLETDARAEIEKERTARELQQIAQNKAYHDAMVGLRQQEVDKNVSLAAIQIGKEEQRQQALELRQKMIASGSDPKEVERMLWPYLSGGTMGGLPQMYRSDVEQVEPSFEVFEQGGKRFFKATNEKGGVRFGQVTETSATAPGNLTEQQQLYAASLQREISAIEKRYPEMWVAEKMAERMPQIKADLERYKFLRSELNRLGTDQSVTTAPTSLAPPPGVSSAPASTNRPIIRIERDKNGKPVIIRQK